MVTLTIRNAMIESEIISVIESSPKHRATAMLNGKRIKLALVNGGSSILRTTSRNRGVFISDEDLAALTNIRPVQYYSRTSVKNLMAWKRFILKNRHPNLWDNLRKEAESITDEKLKMLEEAEQAHKQKTPHHYFSTDIYKQIGLPSIEHHKTITLQTVKCPYWQQERILHAIAHKEDLRVDWRGDYDYHVELKNCEDGTYKGWLSQEFKGCGNGHYWLLISPTQAIFCEKD